MLKIACLSALLVVSVVPSVPAQQARIQPPPRDNSPQGTGTAVIRGRVLAADTGLPLRRALIGIGSPALGESRASYTDAQGRYEINNLPAGRYNVSASKGSYVSLSYGQTRTFQPGKPLQLRDGEILEKIDFSLPRGGVITGTVIDEFGEPVVNSTVSTYRSEFVAGLRRLAPTGRVSQTNDLGEFRVFGLPPGQYYVAASSGLPMSDDRVRYTPTYSRPDQDGRFTATGLPPGDYLAIALDYVEPGTQTEPEFLERVLARATRFSLAEGETKTLNLRLQPSP